MAAKRRIVFFVFAIVLILSILLAKAQTQSLQQQQQQYDEDDMVDLDEEAGKDESDAAYEQQQQQQQQRSSKRIEDMTAIELLFGDTLYTWGKGQEQIEERETLTLLKEKNVLGVYFSASWCGPCRQFTPALAKFYTEMNKKGKKFEIIWISKDRSTEEFVEYYRKMPWLAVTVENLPEKIQKLSALYQVKGIPHFVLIDADDGSIINLDGRTKIIQDKYGLEFPWRSRSLVNLIPKSLRKLIGAEISRRKVMLINMLRGVLESLAPAKVVNAIFGAVGGSQQQHMRNAL